MLVEDLFQLQCSPPVSCMLVFTLPCVLLILFLSCVQQNLEFDLPQSAYAHMDPILYKKIDWETTQGLDLLHHIAHQGMCVMFDHISLNRL